jgi:hypothetical protein
MGEKKRNYNKMHNEKKAEDQAQFEVVSCSAKITVLG